MATHGFMLTEEEVEQQVMKINENLITEGTQAEDRTVNRTLVSYYKHLLLNLIAFVYSKPISITDNNLENK